MLDFLKLILENLILKLNYLIFNLEFLILKLDFIYCYIKSCFVDIYNWEYMFVLIEVIRIYLDFLLRGRIIIFMKLLRYFYGLLWLGFVI